MTEKWAGQYSIDLTPTQPISKTVTFQLEWTIENGHFTGTCVDSNLIDVFDTPATIEGYIDDGVISFLKTYPCYWTIDLDNKVTLYKDALSQEIHYSGTRVEDHFEGYWHFMMTYLYPDGKYEEIEQSGSWIIHRIPK